MSRRYSIIAIALVPAFVALVLLLLVSRVTLERWVLERMERDHSTFAQNLAADIATKLEYQQNQLQLLARSGDFADLPELAHVDPGIHGLPPTLEPRKRALLEMVRQQADFSVLFVLSPNGDHYISHPFEVQKNLRQFNLADRPYFQQARSTKQAVLSEMFKGADGRLAVAMDVPVTDAAGAIVLHLGGVVHLEKLQAAITPDQIHPFDGAVLTDAKGQLLASSDPTHSSFDGRGLLPQLHAVTRVTPTPASGTARAQQQLITVPDGTRWIVFSTDAGAGWTLHALRQESRLLAEIQPALNQLTALATLALLLPTLLGLAMALRYSRRSYLAEKALHQANAALEARVEERTQALSRSETRHRVLFESAPDAVFILQAGRIIDCNPAALTLFGASTQRMLIGRQARDLAPAVQADGSATVILERQYMRELLQGKAPFLSFDWTLLRLDTGEPFFSTVRLSSMQVGQDKLIQANVRDITKAVRAQEDLRIAATAFESYEGITVTDSRHCILRVNKAFTRITGYQPEEVLGKTPRILQSGRHDAAFYERMHETLQRDGVWQGEVWNRRKSGEVYPQLLTITVVKSAAGAVTHYVGIFLDETAEKAAAQRIEDLAFFDPLTGLANRRLLLDRLSQAQTSSARHARHNALLFVDLDEFKVLNDTLGHDVGDDVLRQVARRLHACLREGDTAARSSADEFVLMLEDLSEDPVDAAKQAETVAEKVRWELAQPYTTGTTSHHSSCCIGITLFGGTTTAGEDSPLRRAELAMFQAKHSGRNACRFFDPSMQEAINQRATMEVELRQAIERGQLALHYQPQVVGNGRICGCEALVRWYHPSKGIVPPVQFIPLAEQTGLIVPLGEWVLHEACRQLAAWAQHPSTQGLTVAVNVSARQFLHADFVAIVGHALEQASAPARMLKLELTESMLAHDLEDLIAKMNQLKALGVGFSLDDFGTGYSSLSYLKRLPLDQLKIDQSFVRNLLTDANDVAIAKMIVALADSLNLAVIAEGVEYEAQRECLERLGCYAYQGYLFGAPEPMEQLRKRLPSTPS